MQKDPAQNEDTKPPGNHLLIRISPHLKKLAKHSSPIKREFFPSDDESLPYSKTLSDPLCEDRFIKTKGLVRKYPNRVLIELTMNCASYCRFCTRRRMVSDIKRGEITPKDIRHMVEYIHNNQEINEVVLSGGDPLTVPETFIDAINQFKKLPQLKIIRIHTRILTSNPSLLSPKILNALKSLKQTLYVSLHFEHPDEITKEAIRGIKKLRTVGTILLNQNVFLKGVNDSYEVLYELYNRLTELGVRPYYIYHCDPVSGAAHFIVPLEKEIEIMTKLKENLSGIAFPLHVIDAPNGSGKIPVPQDFWKFNKTSFSDFNGKKIEVINLLSTTIHRPFNNYFLNLNQLFIKRNQLHALLNLTGNQTIAKLYLIFSPKD